MSETKTVQKYTGDVITEDQFNELVQTMNVGVLTIPQRASFLYFYAKSLGLDPLTKPFDLIPGQSGKLIIYANRACSDQLRKIHKLNIEVLYNDLLQAGPDKRTDVWCVRVRVSDPTSRYEDHVGCVGVEGLTGEAYANAVMKCSTKASRRGTIAFCGLGMLDETEVSSFAPGVSGDNVIPTTATTISAAPVRPRILDSKPLPAANPPAKV